MRPIRTAVAASLALFALAGAAPAQPYGPAKQDTKRSLNGGVWKRETPNEQGHLVTMAFHDNGVFTLVTFDPSDLQPVEKAAARFRVANNALTVFEGQQVIVTAQVVWVDANTIRLVSPDGSSTTWTRLQ
jgi:hypothetical protein